MAKAAILVVDDSPTNLRVLRAMLNPDDYDIVVADSSQSALDLVRANPGFGLILLDVAMPDLSGIEVCRTLKSDPRTEHIPVLLISGLRMSAQSVSEGMEAGADGYLMKPLEESELRSWVKAALQIGRLSREAGENSADGAMTDEEAIEKAAGLSRAVNDSLHAVWAAADRLAANLPADSKNRQLIEEIRLQVDKVAREVTDVSRSARDRLGK